MDNHFWLHGVAVQADGGIVVAGSSNSGDFALARYRTDGSLDTSFQVGSVFGAAARRRWTWRSSPTAGSWPSA